MQRALNAKFLLRLDIRKVFFQRNFRKSKKECKFGQRDHGFKFVNLVNIESASVLFYSFFIRIRIRIVEKRQIEGIIQAIDRFILLKGNIQMAATCSTQALYSGLFI